MSISQNEIPQQTAAAPHDGAPTDHGLKKNSLGVSAIVFYIIAAASPLTGVVAIVPIMIGLGNGAGTPASFVVAAGILVLFAVGYLAMGRHVTNAGALYSYVTCGLGRVTGLGSASLTVFSYSSIQFSLYGGFGYYLSSLVRSVTGLDVPWWACAVLAMVLCLGLGLRGAHAGGMILGILITLECLMLIVLGAGIVFSPDTHAADGLTLEPFSVSALFASGVGVSVMFALTTFIGFEGSAIYCEEAKNPRRTIPRATYFAVVFMAAVYAVTSFLIVNATGTADAKGIAQSESGNLIFFVSGQALGPWAAHVFQVLIVTAIFAAIVTFHNNLSRYLYAIGRQGLVWKRLGHTSRVNKTPHVAAVTQTISAAIVVLAFAVIGLDPYTTLFTWLAGIGTLGIIGAQTIAAVAILVFFRRTKVDTRLWHTKIAPTLAILGMLAIFVVAVSSVELLLGTSGPLTVILVGLVPASALLGIGYALWIRARSPQKYEQMRVLLTSNDSTTPA
ncbi:APC family permease [Rhodococcus sp. NPDC056960]|uniref:APC family permease n=1 Tax=Rhodococcus sp. NPDC056960 TaxID=3345982 RepID=UPI0036365FC1